MGRWRSLRTMRAAMLSAIVFFLLIGGGCAERITYPVDYIPPAEFLLGPEDVLVITVWKNQELSREVIVRPDGMISVPLIGDIQAFGLTAEVLAKRITERLKEYMASPTVSVQVKEINSYFIYVVGEVIKPGKYAMKSYATVWQGVSLAGGFSPFASREKMHVIRISKDGNNQAHQIQIPVSYSDMLSDKGAVGNFFLRSGDVIVVP